jgi:hypothetical protein
MVKDYGLGLTAYSRKLIAESWWAMPTLHFLHGWWARQAVPRHTENRKPSF